jgi:uncharacterized protein
MTLQAWQSNVLIATESAVTKMLGNQRAGHDMDHVRRVVANARWIQQQIGGDPFVIELAAWLHDVGDAKFHGGQERSGTRSREILEDLAVEADVVGHVVAIVDNISFRKGTDAKKLSKEGQIVQDADRLDAIGAVGIVRTIEYGAAIGQAFYHGDTTAHGPTGIQHFHDKLFKLTELMNTEPARQMAQNREEFMRSFLEQFLAEWEGRR